MIIFSPDKRLGWAVNGEIRVHEQPPFDPARQRPTAAVILEPDRVLEDMISMLRRATSTGDYIEALVGEPGRGKPVLWAKWKVAGYHDDWGIQRQGWHEAPIMNLTKDFRTTVVRTQRVPKLVKVGEGRPIFSLICRLHEDLSNQRMDIVIKEAA